jgi:hypothetical protein
MGDVISEINCYAADEFYDPTRQFTKNICSNHDSCAPINLCLET